MEERKLVLIDPEIKGEPLYLDFMDNIHISCQDLIVCEIPLNIAYKFLERQVGTYFEEHIVVYGEVEKYLLELEKKKKTEEKVWNCIERTEKVFKEMK